jgi:divalent metal cation (Fe/Co/Zn/Cd) transporter
MRIDPTLATARLLLLATIGYNLAEGVIALWAGVAAGSLALIAFGADSYLEVAAAGVVLWRLGVAGPDSDERMERFAVRFISVTFLILVAAIVYQGLLAFANGDGARESPVGIGLAVASVAIMPALALWKLRIAAKTNLYSLATEAKETIACWYLSATLLVGLVANAWLGWWWLDPLTALLLVPWLVREGWEGIRGEDHQRLGRLCSCRSCLYGLRRCTAVCCAV